MYSLWILQQCTLLRMIFQEFSLDKHKIVENDFAKITSQPWQNNDKKGHKYVVYQF